MSCIDIHVSMSIVMLMATMPSFIRGIFYLCFLGDTVLTASLLYIHQDLVYVVGVYYTGGS